MLYIVIDEDKTAAAARICPCGDVIVGSNATHEPIKQH